MLSVCVLTFSVCEKVLASVTLQLKTQEILTPFTYDLPHYKKKKFPTAPQGATCKGQHTCLLYTSRCV